MKDLIIASTTDFNYSGEVSYQINDFILRLNDTNQSMDKLIGDTSIWDRMGTVFKCKLLGVPYFIKEDRFKDTDDFNEKRDRYTKTLSLFMNFLWFVKDNSCNVDEMRYDWKSANASSVSMPTVINTNAKGKLEPKSFSVPELQYALNAGTKFISLGDSKKSANSSNNNKDKSAVTHSSENRIERAITFLFNARGSQKLPTKITFYVLILECLFVTENAAEISHKLSERVAIYIGKTLEEKLAYSKDVKTFYSLRSKYIHGQFISNSTESLEEISTKLDNLVRKILIKVILTDSDIFLSNDNSLTAWFNEKIFNQYPVLSNEGDSDTISS